MDPTTNTSAGNEPAEASESIGTPAPRTWADLAVEIRSVADQLGLAGHIQLTADDDRLLRRKAVRQAFEEHTLDLAVARKSQPPLPAGHGLRLDLEEDGDAIAVRLINEHGDDLGRWLLPSNARSS